MTAETETATPAVAGTEVAIAPPNLPALADDHEVDIAKLIADAQKNPENLGLNDLSVPYIYLLQPGSPQVKEGEEKQVAGAKASMFFNTASGEMWEGRTTGFTFIPVAYERKISEWLDRDKGTKGWVADHSVESGITAKAKKDEKKRLVLPNGNVLQETAFHYILGRSATGRWFKAIMPMKSTGLAGSRRINDLVADSILPLDKTGGVLIPAKRWYYPMLVKSFLETVGVNSWWKYDVDKLGPTAAHPVNYADGKPVGSPVGAKLYAMAEEFADQFAKGLVSRATPLDDDDAPASGNRASAKDTGGADLDDEIPF